jgi:hypothetical protein
MEGSLSTKTTSYPAFPISMEAEIPAIPPPMTMAFFVKPFVSFI